MTAIAHTPQPEPTAAYPIPGADGHLVGPAGHDERGDGVAGQRDLEGLRDQRREAQQLRVDRPRATAPPPHGFSSVKHPRPLWWSTRTLM